MGHVAVHESLTEAARSAVEALGVAFVPGNRAYAADDGETWVRAVYQPLAADNAALGGARVRVDFVLGFSIYVPTGDGDQPALEIADALLAVFDNRTLDAAGTPVVLRAGAVTRPGTDDQAPQFLRVDVGFPGAWDRQPASRHRP